MSRTPADRLKELQARHEEAVRTLEAESAILAILPETIKSPTISNIGSSYLAGMRVYAWLSFDTYRTHNCEPGSLILRALEEAGFRAVATTLCRWAQYRAAPQPGLIEDIPETRGTRHVDTLTNAKPIAPLWLDLSNHGQAAHTFYHGPDGKIYKVSVMAPSAVHVTARRIEFPGGWRYERGTARLSYPQSWHSLYMKGDETPVTQIAKDSRAYVTLEQAIDGSLYFTPLTEQADFPLSPADMLEQLEASK